jgi:hypothetical protein
MKDPIESMVLPEFTLFEDEQPENGPFLIQWIPFNYDCPIERNGPYGISPVAVPPNAWRYCSQEEWTEGEGFGESVLVKLYEKYPEHPTLQLIRLHDFIHHNLRHITDISLLALVEALLKEGRNDRN